MQDRITLCGDNCTFCPRYNAHTKEELKQVAERWYHLGWRDRVVSPDEINCPGCNPNKQCPYGLIDCTWEHRVRHCVSCVEYPCQKIERMLKKFPGIQNHVSGNLQRSGICGSQKSILRKAHQFRQKG